MALHYISGGRVLLKIRNPHGKDDYWGPWHDGDEESWDSLGVKDRKKNLRVDNKHDGFFFMEWDNFIKTFISTAVTYDVEGWHSDYFLRINDNLQDGVEGGQKGSECTTCYGHNLEVYSEVAQTVYVTAQTHDDQRNAE